MSWNPRGEVRWPEWRSAAPGMTRVEHVRTGERGTFARWSAHRRGRNPGHAVIRWDSGGHGPVVAYAYDLRQIET